MSSVQVRDNSALLGLKYIDTNVMRSQEPLSTFIQMKLQALCRTAISQAIPPHIMPRDMYSKISLSYSTIKLPIPHFTRDFSSCTNSLVLMAYIVLYMHTYCISALDFIHPRVRPKQIYARITSPDDQVYRDIKVQKDYMQLPKLTVPALVTAHLSRTHPIDAANLLSTRRRFLLPSFLPFFLVFFLSVAALSALFQATLSCKRASIPH